MTSPREREEGKSGSQKPSKLKPSVCYNKDTMAELTNINGETLGEDEYGAYGTLLQPESDFAIPEPLELIPPNPDPDANEAE
jgi:hypothetical protein